MRRGRITGLPRGGGEFGALQLADDLQRAIHAVQLRAGREVLPAIQESVELGGGDGLDLAAQAADGEAVDARQQAAVAPFELGRARRERAAQDLAFGFELRQRLVDQVARQGEVADEIVGASSGRSIRTSRAGSRRRSARANREARAWERRRSRGRWSHCG